MISNKTWINDNNVEELLFPEMTHRGNQSDVTYMKKPDSWFLLARCLKIHLWKSDILSKDARQWPASLVKMSVLTVSVFSHILLLKTNYLVCS